MLFDGVCSVSFEVECRFQSKNALFQSRNHCFQERHGMPISEETWTLLLTLTSSFVIVGGFIGSTTTKYWLTFLSKKRLLQVCHVLIIISILLLALVGCLTWSYEVMIIGRLVFGISLGIFFGKTCDFILQ